MAGLAATLGSGAMTNSIGEIEFNDVLFIIGSNATEAHPIIGNKMKQRRDLRGAKLIVVDPRRTELAELRAPLAAPQAGHRQRPGQRPAAT